MTSRILETRKTRDSSCELNRSYRLLLEKLDQKHQNFDVHLIIDLSIAVQLNQRSSQLVIELEIVSFSKISRSSVLWATHVIRWLDDCNERSLTELRSRLLIELRSRLLIECARDCQKSIESSLNTSANERVQAFFLQFWELRDV